MCMYLRPQSTWAECLSLFWPNRIVEHRVLGHLPHMGCLGKQPVVAYSCLGDNPNGRSRPVNVFLFLVGILGQELLCV